MKHETLIGSNAGRYPRVCTTILAVVLLTALAAGGCSSAVSTGPQPADDAKQTPSEEDTSTTPVATAEVETPATPAAATENVTQGLPRLLDLGAGKCIPCKMMAPILDELKEQYAGVFEVEFIDVWEKPAEAEKYGIESIPTQIFFDASGKELFRHEGFFSKEDILGKWKEFGVERKEGKDV